MQQAKVSGIPWLEVEDDSEDAQPPHSGVPQEAIRVFVRAALPWATGISEEDFHSRLNREPGMVR